MAIVETVWIYVEAVQFFVETVWFYVETVQFYVKREHKLPLKIHNKTDLYEGN